PVVAGEAEVGPLGVGPLRLLAVDVDEDVRQRRRARRAARRAALGPVPADDDAGGVLLGALGEHGARGGDRQRAGVDGNGDHRRALTSRPAAVAAVMSLPPSASAARPRRLMMTSARTRSETPTSTLECLSALPATRCARASIGPA